MFSRHLAGASEKRTIEAAKHKLPLDHHAVNVIFERVQLYLPEHKPLKVLEVGSAQGGKLIAIQQLGHEAYGIDPYGPAREIGFQLAEEMGVSICLEAGVMENIPYPAEMFDFVLAASVVEHVAEFEKAFHEVYRVLRPGGVFWFSCESALCPRQGEIRGFPLFGWYPDAIKQRIMLWARDNRPELIGYTDTPALTWMTPWKAGRTLKQAGFTEIWDRWQLRHPSEDTSWVRVLFVRAARRHALVRLLGDMLNQGSSYAARKPKYNHLNLDE